MERAIHITNMKYRNTIGKYSDQKIIKLGSSHPQGFQNPEGPEGLNNSYPAFTVAIHA